MSHEELIAIVRELEQRIEELEYESQYAAGFQDGLSQRIDSLELRSEGL